MRDYLEIAARWRQLTDEADHPVFKAFADRNATHYARVAQETQTGLPPMAPDEDELAAPDFGYWISGGWEG